MDSFLFYDTETTGLNSAFDQILTFAAIRTDTDLNEIERYSITIQMRPDIVPSPGAFVTHRLTPEDLKQGICEYEGACIIHGIVNKPGTISIGYNSLGFDDEFLRFTFYRNLLDPYSHQYADGCYRIDLLPITTIYRIFRPEIIQWPEMDDGKSTLKLELISKINGFVTSGRAHDAIADVEATVELAKCFMKDEDMLRYCFGFFDKQVDRKRIDDFTHAIMVSTKFGADSMYMAPVLGIGRSSHYANQSLWLRLDRDIIPQSGILSHEELFAVRKKDGEPDIILPPLPRFWNRLSDEQKISAEKNLYVIHENQKNNSLFKKIVEYHRQFKYQLVPEADLDSVLYQTPFFNRAEKREIYQFHNSSFMEKIALVKSMKSSRIKSIATRILFRNYMDKGLPPFICREYQNYMERVRLSTNDIQVYPKKIIGFKKDERLVPEKALEELLKIRREVKLDGEQKKILEWLEGYIGSM
ncbi:MAG: exodeoxyribonuclease I [Desulfamplus sp.]|nr:exodeoxyribonuclease I [Desulfamplus sp.]